MNIRKNNARKKAHKQRMANEKNYTFWIRQTRRLVPSKEEDDVERARLTTVHATRKSERD